MTKEQIHKKNMRYRNKIAKRGLQITGFLIPIAIRAEVKRYIEARAMQYAFEQQKKKV